MYELTMGLRQANTSVRKEVVVLFTTEADARTAVQQTSACAWFEITELAPMTRIERKAAEAIYF